MNSAQENLLRDGILISPKMWLRTSHHLSEPELS